MWRGVGIVILFVVILLGAMILLPLAILYFIDPSIADIFLTYSAPYMLVPILVVLVPVLVIALIARASAQRRASARASFIQNEQFGASLPVQTQETMIRAKPSNEEGMVHEIIRIRCQYCGTLNLETATKCESCGANL